jgi:hypothetical protein
LFLEEEALKNSYGSIQILTDSVTHLWEFNGDTDGLVFF